jgi:hypothetical protein
MESVEFSDVGLFRAQNIHRIMQPLDGTVTMNLHSRALEPGPARQPHGPGIYERTIRSPIDEAFTATIEPFFSNEYLFY